MDPQTNQPVNYDRQLMSIHLPENSDVSNRSAILFVRGTGKSLDYFYDNAVDAAKAGYVAATIDFRRYYGYGENSQHMPDQLEDIRCAIQYLKSNSNRLDFNPDNIGVVGYSIGAITSQMAIYANASELPNNANYSSRCLAPEQDTSVKAFVSMSGASDGVRVFAEGVGSSRAMLKQYVGLNENDDMSFVGKLYNPETKTWSQNLNSTQQALVNKVSKYSPLKYIDDSITTYFMHGIIDQTISCKHSIENWKAATPEVANPKVASYLYLGGNDHNWGDYKLGEKAQARKRYMAFFDHYVAGKAITDPALFVNSDESKCL